MPPGFVIGSYWTAVPAWLFSVGPPSFCTTSLPKMKRKRNEKHLNPVLGELSPFPRQHQRSSKMSKITHPQTSKTVVTLRVNTSTGFSNAEGALILNWCDYCLTKQQSFRDTIVWQLRGRFGTDRNWKSINDKIRNLLKPAMVDRSLTYQDFLEQGMKCVRVARLKNELVHELRKGREELQLPPLDDYMSTGGERGEGSKTHDTGHSIQKELQTPLARNAGSSHYSDMECDSGNESSPLSSPPTYNSDQDRNPATVPKILPFHATIGTGKSMPPPRQVSCDSCRRSKTRCVRKGPACERCLKIGKRCQKKEISSQSQKNKKKQTRDISVSVQPRISDTSTRPTQYARSSPGHNVGSTLHSPVRVELERVSTPRNAFSRSEDEDARMKKLLASHEARADHLSTLYFDLLRDVQRGRQFSQEEIDRMRSIGRTVDSTDSQKLLQLTRDLDTLDKRNARNVAKLLTLTGGRNVTGPGMLAKCDINARQVNDMWQKVRARIDALVGRDNHGPLPSPEDLGYIASHMARLLERPFPEESVPEFVSKLPLQNRFVFLTLLSVLLCRSVFADATSLFLGQHCAIASIIYETMSATDGLEYMRNFDTCATKLLIRDTAFKNDQVPRVAKSLASRLAHTLSFVLCSKPKLEDTFDFYELCKEMLLLKLELITSTKEYRIFFALPGEEYNAEWMVAEDENGHAIEPEACKSRKVKLCWFPAISQCEGTMAGVSLDDISTAFACNKPFNLQRMIGDEISPDSVVAKAVVLMDHLSTVVSGNPEV
ncbi:hypothetical protein K504DRAFT_494844 [Pleomassaria siparia CBS 279.74]|uniref:Zn(2)-C6 fungal-type domain-containing protein n=1 Tax=Pleomassaria siparia CBS 279.74 TaxID=1314801 RepID=A0A6G1JWE3_9PLEO|nr:hypothetical protein K504DRAFT_494844 [Pleomassaria siparia CBS 279.74]